MITKAFAPPKKLEKRLHQKRNGPGKEISQAFFIHDFQVSWRPMAVTRISTQCDHGSDWF
ncbi:MAG TPA: hypothetical protein DCS88_03680 [Alphaproteobacteria bacterium]|nr:hypothetical protein [Alphaproteobacteria bacterium]